MGVEDNSLTDHMAIDLGMEKTKKKASTVQKSNTAKESDKKLQVCFCGWKKITSAKGLKIHQGKKMCLMEREQGPRINQYLLRSQSSQSSEVQQLEPNQSSQDISPPVPVSEEVNSSTEEVAKECPSNQENWQGRRILCKANQR